MPSSASQRIWHKWILVPLWTVHLFILIPPLFQLLVLRIRHPLSGWTLVWLLDDFAMLLCLILEGAEIARWRGERLQPGFYLRSTAFKAGYFTWNLWLIARQSLRMGLRFGGRHLLVAGLQL